MVYLPGAIALAVVLPCHPGLELRFDVRAECHDVAAKILERALFFAPVESIPDTVCDNKAQMASRIADFAGSLLDLMRADLTSSAI